MSFNVGDEVRYVATPAQIGHVTRMHPLQVVDAMVITWDQGPMYDAGHMTALFGDDCLRVEHTS